MSPGLPRLEAVLYPTPLILLVSASQQLLLLLLLAKPRLAVVDSATRHDMPCAGTHHAASLRAELGVNKWRTAEAGAAGAGRPGAAAAKAAVMAAVAAVVGATSVAAGDVVNSSHAVAAGIPARAAGATSGGAVTFAAAAAAGAGALAAEWQYSPSCEIPPIAASFGLTQGRGPDALPCRRGT